jgi:HK97 family phage major capsid protein
MEMTQEQFQSAIKAVVDEAVGDAAGTAVDKYVKGLADQIKDKTDEQIAGDPVLRLFSPKSFDKEKPDPRNPAQKLGAAMRYLTAEKGDRKAAAGLAEKLGDIHMKNALLTTDFDRGGSMIPETMAASFFEALRPRSIVRAAGAQVLPMPNGTAYIPGVTGGATATYGAEGANQNATSLTTGRVQLTQKRLMAIVVMSLEMLDVADVRMDEIVARDLLAAAGAAEDAAFLDGDGTEGKCLGILRQMAAANSAASSTSTVDDVKNELKALRKTLRTAHHVNMPEDGAYLMDTDVEEDLMDLYKGDFHLYPEMGEGRVRRYGYQAGNNMPSGTLAFADMSEVFIGQSDNVSYEVFRSGSVTDTQGSTVHLISSYQAAARIAMHHDIALRRTTALAKRTSVDYSAL